MIGLVAAAAPVVVHLSSGVSTWEKVAAVFTAVGGIGAMLGGIFAWRAATASGRAARDAADALAASLKPNVHLACQPYYDPGQPDAQGPIEVRAVVVAPLSPGRLAGMAPATDVRLEFMLASGRHGSTTLAVLEPGSDIYGTNPPYINVVVGRPDEHWPPEGGDRVTATITYSDVRGVGRYRLSQSWLLHPSADVGVVSFRDPTEPMETRIRP